MNRAEKRAYVSQEVGVVSDYDGIVKAHPWLIARMGSGDGRVIRLLEAWENDLSH